MVICPFGVEVQRCGRRASLDSLVGGETPEPHCASSWLVLSRLTKILKPLIRTLMLVLVVATLPLAAQERADTTRLQWVPNPQTTTRSWVSDPAGHLRSETKARIDSTVAALRAETTAEIGLAVLDSLDGLDGHTAAFTLHRRWGVGEHARDNGVVLLWSPALRQTYISVGPGLEGVIPDAVAGRIQDDVILPRFRRGDFDGGILAGIEAIATTARGETYAGRPTERRSAARIVSTIAQSLLGIIVFLGAIVGWRRRPRRCPRGHGWMTKLSERADNAELSREEVLEENLGSMNYHVWVCNQCDERLIVPRTRWWVGYEKCPQCKRRSVKKTTKALVAATYTSAGEMEVTLNCRNCGYASTKRVSIPRKQRGASSGGGFGGRSGGGGGFGGGSSAGAGAGRSY
jgi:uncharacterized protein